MGVVNHNYVHDVSNILFVSYAFVIAKIHSNLNNNVKLFN